MKEICILLDRGLWWKFIVVSNISFSTTFFNIVLYRESHSNCNLLDPLRIFCHLKSFFLIDYGFCGYEHCLSSKLRYCINNVLSSNLHVYHNNFFLHWYKIHSEKKYLLTHFCLFLTVFVCIFFVLLSIHLK